MKKNKHTGYIESCHDSTFTQKLISNNRYRTDYHNWYREEGYDTDFCNALQNNSFIPCGTSGEVPYGHPYAFGFIDCNGSSTYIGSSMPEKIQNNTTTCSFIYGISCCDCHLKRRWTCCGIQFDSVTINEMFQFPCPNNS